MHVGDLDPLPGAWHSAKTLAAESMLLTKTVREVFYRLRSLRRRTSLMPSDGLQVTCTERIEGYQRGCLKL